VNPGSRCPDPKAIPAAAAPSRAPELWKDAPAVAVRHIRRVRAVHPIVLPAIPEAQAAAPVIAVTKAAAVRRAAVHRAAEVPLPAANRQAAVQATEEKDSKKITGSAEQG